MNTAAIFTLPKVSNNPVEFSGQSPNGRKIIVRLTQYNDELKVTIDCDTYAFINEPMDTGEWYMKEINGYLGSIKLMDSHLIFKYHKE